MATAPPPTTRKRANPRYVVQELDHIVLGGIRWGVVEARSNELIAGYVHETEAQQRASALNAEAEGRA